VSRPSRIEISIPVASPDGRYYGRYPQGNAPYVLRAGASDSTAAGAGLTTAIRMAAAGVSSAAAAAVLTTGGGGVQALVSWTAPTTNADGSALTDLAGFHVYYGTDPEAPTSMMSVANPSATSANLTGLTSGTWYFWVMAYDSDGNESPASARASEAL